MVDKVKRNMLLLPLAISGVSAFAHTNMGSLGLEHKNRKAEFQYVYACWKKKFSYEPESYLLSQGVSLQEDKEQIQAISRQDFKKGNTLEINGFILSKIETALMAATGKFI